MATSKKRASRKAEGRSASSRSPPRSRRPRSPRIRMVVDGDERRVVIGPARRTFDIVFSLACVTVMVAFAGGLAWRTRELLHHSPAAVIAVLAGMWIAVLFLGLMLAIQIGWRVFGREEIVVRDATLSLDARLLGGRINSRIPADRRLVARLDEIPTRAKRYVYPKFRLVFVTGSEQIATVSTLTKDEGDAALVMARRILPG